MSSTDDPETERIHQEIAGYIEQITDRYHQLLDVMEHERLGAGL
jgi:hypothetical protein